MVVRVKEISNVNFREHLARHSQFSVNCSWINFAYSSLSRFFDTETPSFHSSCAKFYFQLYVWGLVVSITSPRLNRNEPSLELQRRLGNWIESKKRFSATERERQQCWNMKLQKRNHQKWASLNDNYYLRFAWFEDIIYICLSKLFQNQDPPQPSLWGRE